MSSGIPWSIEDLPTSLLDILAALRECAVCTEQLCPKHKFPAANLSMDCEHPPRVCLECLAVHLTTQLESNGCDGLSCPECSAMLPYSAIQAYASPVTFQRYDMLLARKELSNDATFCWCTAGCGSGQCHPGSNDNPIMICAQCRAKTCFTHQIPWHDGLTCVQYDRQSRGEPIDDPAMIDSSGQKETRQERRDRELAQRLAREDEEAAEAERRQQQQVRERQQAHERQQVREQRAREQRQREERQQQQEEQRRQREQRQRQERQRQEAAQAQVREEANRRRAQEQAASEAAVKKDCKKCPGSCGAWIEKNRGCDHMTCKRPFLPPLRSSQWKADEWTIRQQVSA